MPGSAAGSKVQRGPAAENLGRRRAAVIYGAIVTASILDVVGGHVSTAALVVSVVVTLVVYWLAEEYAEVLGEQVEGRRLPSRAHARKSLAASWPMVSASFLPLLALVLLVLATSIAAALGDRDDPAEGSRPDSPALMPRSGRSGQARSRVHPAGRMRSPAARGGIEG